MAESKGSTSGLLLVRQRTSDMPFLFDGGRPADADGLPSTCPLTLCVVCLLCESSNRIAHQTGSHMRGSVPSCSCGGNASLWTARVAAQQQRPSTTTSSSSAASPAPPPAARPAAGAAPQQQHPGPPAATPATPAPLPEHPQHSSTSRHQQHARGTSTLTMSWLIVGLIATTSSTMSQLIVGLIVQGHIVSVNYELDCR